MWNARRTRYALGIAIVAAMVMPGERSFTQGGTDPNAAPNPYRVEEDWAKLSQGRKWGAAIGVDIDRDGKSVWVFDRCATADDCSGSNLAAIQKFDASGKLVTSFGAGMFNYPHGLFVDRDDNVWVCDGRSKNGKGQTVMKFSPGGKLLMTLGKPGVAGDGPDTFNAPSDVLVAPNGDIFVADGHGGDTNARIVKFAKDGKLIKAWGKKGSAPGEFDAPHGLAMDSVGRLFQTTAYRFSTRTETSWPNGGNSGARAVSLSIRKISSTWRTRHQPIKPIWASSKGFESAA